MKKETKKVQKPVEERLKKQINKNSKAVKETGTVVKTIKLSLGDLLGGPNFVEVNRYKLTDKQFQEFLDNKAAYEAQAKIMNKLEDKRVALFNKWEKKAEKAGFKFDKCTFEEKEKAVTFEKAEFSSPIGKALAEQE